ncbi:hypothetical protein COOONC_27884 [Cooperia oncophora]
MGYIHLMTALDWSDVMAKRDYEKYLVYSRSKLCLHLMAFALHRRMNIARRNVAVNVVELGRNVNDTMANELLMSVSMEIYVSLSEEFGHELPIKVGAATSACCRVMSSFSMCRAAGNLVQLIENPAFETLSGKYLDSMGKQIR